MFCGFGEERTRYSKKKRKQKENKKKEKKLIAAKSGLVGMKGIVKHIRK